MQVTKLYEDCLHMKYFYSTDKTLLTRCLMQCITKNKSGHGGGLQISGDYDLQKWHLILPIQLFKYKIWIVYVLCFSIWLPLLDLDLASFSCIVLANHHVIGAIMVPSDWYAFFFPSRDTNFDLMLIVGHSSFTTYTCIIY